MAKMALKKDEIRLKNIIFLQKSLKIVKQFELVGADWWGIHIAVFAPPHEIVS